MEQPTEDQTEKRRKKNIVATIAIAILITPALGTMILFFVVSRQSSQVNATCQQHMETLGAAFMAYAQKHDGNLPPAANWAESIKPYVQNAKAFRCPNDLTEGFTSYAMNAALGGKKLQKLTDRNKRVLLYEAAKSGDAPQGNGTDAYNVGHDEGGFGRHGANFYRFNYYLFADGHVDYPHVYKDLQKYVW